MNSSVHVDNKEKDALILGKGPTQTLFDTTLIAEAKYTINFTKLNERFFTKVYTKFFTKLKSTLYGNDSFLFVNATKIYQLKAKDSEIKKYSLGLGNVLQSTI